MTAPVRSSSFAKRTGGANGFTLIELLIVISIIGLLIGLVIAIIPQVRFQAKALETTERMEAILQSFTRLGQQEGSTAYMIQKQLNALNTDYDYGAVLFCFPNGQLTPVPDNGLTAGSTGTLAKGGRWLDMSRKYHFGFPWGKSVPLQSGQSSNSSYPANEDAAADKATTVGVKIVSTVTLNQLNHAKTLQLLAIAGIVKPDDTTTPGVDESLQDYQDASPRKQWNDGWGHQMVVAYGIFQPSDSVALGAFGNETNAGKKVQKALDLWQYNRSIYLTIGAAGPSLQNPINVTTAANTATTVTNLWNQVTNVCDAANWKEDSFDHPPWQGVKRGRKTIAGREYRSLLSAPLEFK